MVASESITFPAAIAQTQALLDSLAAGTAPTDLAAEIATLVSTMAGARGFFVAFLTGDYDLADHPTAAVLDALQRSPQIVSELLVKNLAMSTAMAIAHRRSGDEAMAQGSDRVRSRTTQLLQRLPRALWAERAIAMQTSTETTGADAEFLDRWGYDTEQRQAIGQSLHAVLTSGSTA